MDFRYELVMPNEGLPFRMFIFEGKDGNYKVTKHWHQSVELFLVLEGTIGFFINSRYTALGEKEFVIVNANEIHSIDCPDPNVTIVLQIPAEAFEHYRDEAPYINFGRGSREVRAQLVELVTDMYRTYEEKEYGYLLRVKGEFYQLLYLLVTRFKEGGLDAETVRQRRQLDKLSQVTEFMKDHYREDIRLEQVAARFGFSPTYLSRIFQKYAQMNYRTYLIDLRVKYAARELINTDREIGDIALDHGFPDGRAFARAFKKRYGCLPSQYRKNLSVSEWPQAEEKR